MRKAIRWIDQYIEEKIILFLYFVMVVLLFIEVVKRYVFSASSPYVAEICIVMFMWIVFLGFSYGIKIKAHIVIDILPKKMPPLLNLLLEMIVNVIIATVMIVLIYYAYEVLSFMQRLNMKMDATELPTVYLMSVSMVGFVGSIIRLIQNSIESIKTYQQIR